MFCRCTSDAQLTSASLLYPLRSALVCAITPFHQETWLATCTPRLTRSIQDPSAFWPQLLHPLLLQPPMCPTPDQFPPRQRAPAHQTPLSPPSQTVNSTSVFLMIINIHINAMLVCYKQSQKSKEAYCYWTSPLAAPKHISAVTIIGIFLHHVILYWRCCWLQISYFLEVLN